jgi:hypothetical protein
MGFWHMYRRRTSGEVRERGRSMREDRCARDAPRSSGTLNTRKTIDARCTGT